MRLIQLKRDNIHVYIASVGTDLKVSRCNAFIAVVSLHVAVTTVDIGLRFQILSLQKHHLVLLFCMSPPGYPLETEVPSLQKLVP